VTDDNFLKQIVESVTGRIEVHGHARRKLPRLERAGLIKVRLERGFSPTSLFGAPRFRVDVYASLTPAGVEHVAKKIRAHRG